MMELDVKLVDNFQPITDTIKNSLFDVALANVKHFKQK